MVHATVGLQPATRIGLPTKVGRDLIVLAWCGIVALAVGFVLKYVFHYYLNYNPTVFYGCWPRRGGSFLHITGGMLALLTAPWQFFTGLRRRYMNVHRWIGRVFLLGAAAENWNCEGPRSETQGLSELGYGLPWQGHLK